MCNPGRRVSITLPLSRDSYNSPPLSFDLEFPLELDDEFWVASGTPPTLSAPICLPSSTPLSGGSKADKSNTPPQARSPIASGGNGEPRNLIPAFTALIKLMKLLSFSLRTIYSINKSKVDFLWLSGAMTDRSPLQILLGLVGPEWEGHIRAEMDSAGNRWVESLPIFREFLALAARIS